MKWLLPLALLAVSHPAAPPSAAPEAPLDQAALRRHIEYLASDSLQGRAPGSEGGVKAAYYIASELAGAGLAPGAPDGSWYQPVDLVERTPMTATAEWRVKGHAIALDPSLGRFIAMEGGTRLVAAPVVFAGYGTTTGGADLKGKVVLLLSGKPSEGVQGFEVRRRAIAAQGAAAVIALSGENDPWALIHDQLGRGRTVASGETHAPVEGALAFPAWIRLVDPELVVAAKSLEFSPHLLPVTLDLSATSHVRRYSSVNVIARIAGHGRAGEAVLFLAHWDHLGLCRPEGAADRICNGAVDNASGIAALIEVARRIEHGPPLQRSLYFVATTGEEMGLLGARALVRSPPLPLEHIAAALNFDTIAISPAGEPVATIGRGMTPLDPLIDAAIRSQGRLIDDSEAANAFLGRQDGWALMEAGVPAVMIGGAFSDSARLGAFLAGDYHSPIDDIAHLPPLDGAAEDGALHVVLGRMLADPGLFPLRAK